MSVETGPPDARRSSSFERVEGLEITDGELWDLVRVGTTGKFARDFPVPCTAPA